MAMGRVTAKAQPKKGIQSSSRLINVVCGLTRVCTKSVSQVLWCFTSSTQGSFGRCSLPATSARMPQVHANHLSTSRVHTPITKSNRALLGSSQPTATDTVPQTMVAST